MKDKKSHCLANLTSIKLCDFKMDLIKWQLNLGLCNFGLKSYFSNRTCTACSFDFEIMRMISDQIALHSVRFEFTSMISDLNCSTRSSVVTLLDPFFEIAQFNSQICQTMAFFPFIFLQCDWLD